VEGDLALNIAGVCPACQAGGVTFSWTQCFNRSALTRCRKCDKALESRLSLATYLLMVVYLQAWTVGGALALLAAVLGGAWLWACAILAAFYVCVAAPARWLRTLDVRLYNPLAL
jgi:hypothetical protein